MKKVLLILSIVLIQFINTYAQPYNVNLIITAVLDCDGVGAIPLFSESGTEGKEFLIPEQTLPPQLAQFQSFYDLFAGGIVGLEQGTLKENVTIILNLQLVQCPAQNPNLVELITITAQVIGDKTGIHDPFTYYQFNEGKKAFLKLKIAKLAEFLQKEGVTIDDLTGWFVAQGFTPDVTGISFGSDSEWFYVYLNHFSKIVLGVIKNTTDIKGQVEIPTEFKLEQNFPNPFNPVTQISFALPKDGFTNLTVYNSIGVEVSALISEVKAAGNYSISFNASQLPSGIYFYELSSGSFKSTKKMILLK
jgi:hypothetical protein